MIEQLEQALPWQWIELASADGSAPRAGAMVGGFRVLVGRIPVDGVDVFYVEVDEIEVVDAAETLGRAVQHLLLWMRQRQLDLQGAMSKASAQAWTGVL